MAKMKHFSAAMKTVRKSARDSNGKMKNRKLAERVGQMLGEIRSKNYSAADAIAKNIAKGKSSG